MELQAQRISSKPMFKAQVQWSNFQLNIGTTNAEVQCPGLMCRIYQAYFRQCCALDGQFGFYRQCGVAGGGQEHPAPLGWYFFIVLNHLLKSYQQLTKTYHQLAN